MCVEPTKLDNGSEVACRLCWQCRYNRVNDLVGRCIAESMFAKKTYAVTLTYADDAGVSAVTLTYEHIQNMIRMLRKRYGKVRYIVAGEYGTAKGRAHWHIILFFEEKYPTIDENKRVNWKYWKHGFSYFQNPDWKGFKYVVKYVLKQKELDSSDSHLAMSKKPPLGAKFFMKLAEEHVEQMLVPRSFVYKIKDVRDDKGKEKKFLMQGVTKDNFMQHFKKTWIEKYGEEPPSTEFFEEWDNTNYKVEYNDDELRKRLHAKNNIKEGQIFLDPTEIEDTMWVEFEYAGMQAAAIQEWDNSWFIYTEDEQQWREDRKEVIDELLRNSNVTKRGKATELSEQAHELVKRRGEQLEAQQEIPW